MLRFSVDGWSPAPYEISCKITDYQILDDDHVTVVYLSILRIFDRKFSIQRLRQTILDGTIQAYRLIITFELTNSTDNNIISSGRFERAALAIRSL